MSLLIAALLYLPSNCPSNSSVLHLLLSGPILLLAIVADHIFNRAAFQLHYAIRTLTFSQSSFTTSVGIRPCRLQILLHKIVPRGLYITSCVACAAVSPLANRYMGGYEGMRQHATARLSHNLEETKRPPRSNRKVRLGWATYWSWLCLQLELLLVFFLLTRYGFTRLL